MTATSSHEIVCCLHLPAFEARDGTATRYSATIPLSAYPVRVADDEVFVALETK